LTTADAQPPIPSNSHFIVTGCGAHTDSYTICTEVLSRGIKQQEREGDHSFPPVTRLRISGDITVLPLYAWTERGQGQTYLPH